MKKYVKPVFIAESYMFAYSIAACDVSIGEKDKPDDALLVTEGMKMCPIGDGGHKAGQGTLQDFPLTIFNDGEQIRWINKEQYLENPDSETYQANGCDFDWDGDGAKFTQAFYGNGAGNAENHKPGYNGKAFWS